MRGSTVSLNRGGFAIGGWTPPLVTVGGFWRGAIYIYIYIHVFAEPMRRGMRRIYVGLYLYMFLCKTYAFYATHMRFIQNICVLCKIYALHDKSGANSGFWRSTNHQKLYFFINSERILDFGGQQITRNCTF